MPEFDVLIQHLVVAAIGFAAAGAAASAYRMILNAPARFERPNHGEPMGPGKRVTHVLLLLFAGPFVLARNSYRARRLSNRAVGWLAASGAIGAAWSLMTGLFILTMLHRAGVPLL